MNFLRLKEKTFGELNEKKFNAINWQVTVPRGADKVIANCGLLFVDGDNSNHVHSFDVEIDNKTLQSWGEDDSVIDNKVLTYSPDFEIE